MTYPNPRPIEPSAPRTESLLDTREGFEAMVRAHYDRLCAFAFRLLGERELAEDAVHDVLFRIWRDREQFDFRQPLAYLYRSVHNRAISEQRRSSTRRRWLQEQADVSDVPSSVSDAASVVECGALAHAVARAVESLPERCRLIYTMLRHQGLSYAEIAIVLNITTKTVENQMTRAAKLLRMRLGDYLAFVPPIVAVVAAMWNPFGPYAIEEVHCVLGVFSFTGGIRS